MILSPGGTPRLSWSELEAMASAAGELDVVWLGCGQRVSGKEGSNDSEEQLITP